MFDQNVQAIKAHNADIPAEALQRAIDEVCATVRGNVADAAQADVTGNKGDAVLMADFSHLLGKDSVCFNLIMALVQPAGAAP